MAAITQDRTQSPAQSIAAGSSLGEGLAIIGALLIIVGLFFLPWMGYDAVQLDFLARNSWLGPTIAQTAPPAPEGTISEQQYLTQFVDEYFLENYADGLTGRFVPPTIILSVLPFALAFSALAFAIGGILRPPYRRINTIWVFLIGIFMLLLYHLRTLLATPSLWTPDLGLAFSNTRLGYWLSLVGVILLIVQFFIARPPADMIQQRHAIGNTWQRFFISTNVIALIALATLFIVIIDQSFGLVVYEDTIEPSALSETPLEELDSVQLTEIFAANQGINRLKVLIRDRMSSVPQAEFTQRPLDEVLAGRSYPAEVADLTINDLTDEQVKLIVSDNLSAGEMVDVVYEQVVQRRVSSSWRLFESLFNRAGIEEIAATNFPNGDLEFRSWVSFDFLTSPASSNPTVAGLRTALIGSMLIILITLIVALPLGVAAAIYLEEYADDRWYNQLIEINIRNLAGVPSIIYGLLGLAVFVRALEYLTSGRFVGVTDSNGRTVISAALTLALLILPVIIISAQEALRAVPRAIREGSYGIGATKWQTVQRQVLPAALPGIMTGLILAISRAIGETAPLVAVGASTFLNVDPSGPFSKFTVVPIQIYQWTSRPEAEFKAAAGGAIIVLLVLLLLLNGSAIIIRQRFSRRLQ